MTNKVKTDILFDDLKYHVDVDSENNGDCYTDGCDDEGICRCGTIDNAKVNEVPVDKLAAEIAPESLLVQYCVERILQHFKPLHDPDSWDIEVEGGYYGEEIESVKIKPQVAETLANILLSLNGATDNQVVETALNVEYGFVLPTLKDKTWTLERVALANVELGAKHHAANLNEEQVDKYRINEKPVSGLMLYSDGKYRVIDGYHRITAAKKDKKQVIWAVVGR